MGTDAGELRGTVSPITPPRSCAPTLPQAEGGGRVIVDVMQLKYSAVRRTA